MTTAKITGIGSIPANFKQFNDINSNIFEEIGGQMSKSEKLIKEANEFLKNNKPVIDAFGKNCPFAR